MWSTTNCGKFLKRREYQTTCMQVMKQQLQPDMEQRTGSKLGKEYVKTVLSREVWRTSVHGVAKSWTHLGD